MPIGKATASPAAWIPITKRTLAMLNKSPAAIALSTRKSLSSYLLTVRVRARARARVRAGVRVEG